jgi:hypothetical protein
LLWCSGNIHNLWSYWWESDNCSLRCMCAHNSISTWCSHTQLTALKSFSLRRDHRIGNLRGQGIFVRPATEAFRNPTSTALWIARWFTRTNDLSLFHAITCNWILMADKINVIMRNWIMISGRIYPIELWWPRKLKNIIHTK